MDGAVEAGAGRMTILIVVACIAAVIELAAIFATEWLMVRWLTQTL